MKCDEIRDLLDDYLSGLLGKEQQETVSRHLNTCADCRSELATLRAEQKLLTAHLRPESPPAEVRQSLDSVLPRPASVRGESVGWARWALRLAASVLLAVGVTIVVQSRRRTEPVQTPTPLAPSAERDPEVAQLLADIEMLTAQIEAACRPIRWDDQNGRFPLLSAESAPAQRYLAQAEREAVAAVTLTAARAREKAGDAEGARQRIQFLLAAVSDTAAARAYEGGRQ